MGVQLQTIGDSFNSLPDLISAVKMLSDSVEQQLQQDVKAVKAFMRGTNVFNIAVTATKRQMLALARAGNDPPGFNATQGVVYLTEISGLGEKFWSFFDLVRRVHQMHLSATSVAS